MSQSTLSHAQHIHFRSLKYRRTRQNITNPSRNRPLPSWAVALIAVAAWAAIETVCHLIDCWRW